MSRRSRSTSASPLLPASKRPRLDRWPLTSNDYKNGIMLAPMVRSSSLPTRLLALKYGATLVWGPEVVDKAILHAERVVDHTGVINYNGKTKAIWSTHPIEKPYLIYQIGSANSELAVEAAKTVMNDVSGIDLNCGCPKSFSTSGGMGAALLENPDLLCSILSALRKAMPPEISVSCKIRLLPSQEDTLKLVERIVGTGISALTVHCRTRNMRQKESALIGRLREIVEFVEGLGKGIAVIENGDCVGFEDVKRIRDITGAHSVMIATAAEANPSCFSQTPEVDLESHFVPSYFRLCEYLDNNWGNTKFCAIQFRGAHETGTRSTEKAFKEALSKAKSFADVEELIGPNIPSGEAVFASVVSAIEARPTRRDGDDLNDGDEGTVTPVGWRPNPSIMEILNAPLMPQNELRMYVPAGVSGKDEVSPTGTPGAVEVLHYSVSSS